MVCQCCSAGCRMGVCDVGLVERVLGPACCIKLTAFHALQFVLGIGVCILLNLFNFFCIFHYPNIERQNSSVGRFCLGDSFAVYLYLFGVTCAHKDMNKFISFTNIFIARSLLYRFSCTIHRPKQLLFFVDQYLQSTFWFLKPTYT